MRRVGNVLLTAGLLDVSVMIGAIATETSYYSPFNIAAVIGGLLLRRANLRAATCIRHIAAFEMVIILMAVAVVFVSQPIQLSFLTLRESAWSGLLFAVLFISIEGLLWWTVVELGRAGRGRLVQISAVLAAGLALSVGGVVVFLLHGTLAEYAAILAKEQVGPGYAVHVTGLKLRHDEFGTDYKASVAAWNADEVKRITVEWRW